MSPDIVKVAPKSSKILFENDNIRVIELKFRKGQKLAMHTHPANFVYAVTSGKWKSISPDGKEEIVRIKKGESSMSVGPSKHAVENHIPAVLLQIEFK